MRRLDNQVAIVTGCASKRGIGHAIAIRLAEEGASVAVVDRYRSVQSLFDEDQDGKWNGLDSVVGEINTLGRNGLAVVADVSNSKAVDETVEITQERLGEINILVNAAGIPGARDIPVVNMPEEEWDGVLAVNLKGPFLVCKAVARTMIERNVEGRIINISSIGGKMGVPGHANYSASKFGLIGLTQSLARELAPYRITVNAICPGYIVTNIRDEWLREQSKRLGVSINDARIQFYNQKSSTVIPLKRPGEPSDIAYIAGFLASKEADFITGQSINVDGGQLMEH